VAWVLDLRGRQTWGWADLSPFERVVGHGWTGRTALPPAALSSWAGS